LGKGCFHSEVKRSIHGHALSSAYPSKRVAEKVGSQAPRRPCPNSLPEASPSQTKHKTSFNVRNAAAQGFTGTAYATWPTELPSNDGYAANADTASRIQTIKNKAAGRILHLI
jgi:hypothetical protein